MNKFLLHVISMFVFIICLLIFGSYIMSPLTWWSILIMAFPATYIQGLITKDLFERFGKGL